MMRGLAHTGDGDGKAKPSVKRGPSEAPGLAGRCSNPEQANIATLHHKEEQDVMRLEQLILPLEKKVALVEDAAERVGIVAAPLAMEAIEQLRELQLGALRETERIVKVANIALTAAHREVAKASGEVEGFAPIAKEQATEEVRKICRRLEEAEVKVQEHKTARQAFEAAVAVTKQFDEIALRVAGIELECEKAAIMAEPVQKALDLHTSDIREAMEVVRVAEAMLGPTLRLISAKVKLVQGHTFQQLSLLEKRVEAAKATILKTKKALDEAHSMAAVGPIMEQVADRAAKVEAALQAMRESEAPFLVGVDIVSSDEGKEIMQQMHQAVDEAEAVVADAIKFVTVKEVELARLPVPTTTESKGSLDQVKTQLGAAQKEVGHFKEELRGRMHGKRGKAAASVRQLPAKRLRTAA
mmetsp:Transcript_321/g.1112  ORF Transcript_321/g.1112 Transcript_321/m.1112 type:complete len:413 (+) Transcript_321:49-1287(+)